MHGDIDAIHHHKAVMDHDNDVMLDDVAVMKDDIDAREDLAIGRLRAVALAPMAFS
jgi:hypothetical protein